MMRRDSGSHAAFGRCFESASLALVCLLAMAPAGAQEEGATFRFAPPDGTSCVETGETTQVLDFGQGRTSTTRTEMTVRHSFRKLPDGHSVTATMIGAQVLGPAEGGRQLTLDALKGVPITYKIDQAGRLVEVSGLDDVGRRVRETLPPEAAAILGDAFSKETMIASAEADWERSILNLKDRPADLGSAWLATEHPLLPTGELVEYYVALKVTGKQTMDEKNCLRVEFRYASDPAELRAFLGTQHESLLSGKKPFRGKARVSGRGHRIVDPATLLPYQQKIERVIETTIAVPSRGHMPVTIRQDKAYRYSYEPAD